MSDRIIAIDYIWDAENSVMIPTQSYLVRARRQYANGHKYRLEVREDRSSRSHAHYFACLKDIHDNLSDEQRTEYPTVEHLRKRALIKCKFYNMREYACETIRHAKNLEALAGQLDEYAIVVRKNDVVRVYTAMSQDLHTMDREKFTMSKNAVLDLCSEMIGVNRSTIEKQGGKTA
jgi:hypothetical protein